MNLKVGNRAPSFILLDQEGKKRSLGDYKGKKLLLYFYPKDNTPGCTREACSIRDNSANFKKSEISVLGVSTDSVKSHKKFSDKYKLPFPILADENREVVKKYGVWAKKKFMGREYWGTLRTSFLIDPTGKILKIFQQVKPDTHATDVLTKT